jgi:hypothetical protein
LKTVLLLTISIHLKAQDKSLTGSMPRNTINAYVGVFDLNINYERTLLQRPKSSGKVRLGIGSGKFLTAGEGKYVNAALVHLLGKKKSYLETNLGIKCMITNTISDPKFSEVIIPDLFLGYRFENPSGGFVFRIGINHPTLINFGVGYKF